MMRQTWPNWRSASEVFKLMVWSGDLVSNYKVVTAENWWLIVEGTFLSGRPHTYVHNVPRGSSIGFPGTFFIFHFISK